MFVRRLLGMGVLGASTAMAAEQPLEHVLVTTPIHKKAAETALPVTVMSGEELQRAAAASIGETLNNQPGLTSASFGPGVGQPVIRGQSGPRVRVLENGLGSGDAAAVSADHAVTVEPLLAESIEVLRGPATLLYGGGAIGGVINVIDNRIPSEPVSEALFATELRHDSASDGDTAVFKAEAGNDSWAWHVDGLYREWNDIDIPGRAEREHDEQEEEHEEHGEEAHEEAVPSGSIANSDGRDKQLTVGVSHLWDNGYLGFSVTHMESEYGIPPGGHGHHEEEEGHEEGHAEEEEHADGIRIDMEQTRYNVAGEWRELIPAVAALRYRLAYTDYEHVELEGGEAGTEFDKESWEQRIELVHNAWRGWHGVAGLQWEDSDFSAIGEESFIPRADIGAFGVFLVEDYHWQDFIFELGLRLGRDTVDPEGFDEEEFTTVSASASALWQVGAAWRVGAALSSAERAPVVEELFSNAGLQLLDDCVVHGATSSCEIGDSGLDTERSNNLDLTLSYDFEVLQGFVTVFYNDFEDYIFLQNRGESVGEAPVLYYTQGAAEFTGIEFEATAPVADGDYGRYALTLFGDAIDGELDDGSDVPRLPPLRVGLRLNADAGPWSGYVSVLEADDQEDPGANEEPTDGYTRWDAGVEYRLTTSNYGEYQFFLRGKNLSDEEIRLSTSFLRDAAPEAGRSVEAGVRVVF